VVLLCCHCFLLLSQQPNDLEPGGGINRLQGASYEALVGSLGRLNPVLDAYNSADYDVDRLIFSGLIHHDSRGLPHGDLAETWGISRWQVVQLAIRPAPFTMTLSPAMTFFTIDLMRADYLFRMTCENSGDRWMQAPTKRLSVSSPAVRTISGLPEFGVLPSICWKG
jgi:hypothetical protein